MKRIVIALSTVILISFNGGLFAGKVQAETVNELTEKQTDIQNQRSEIKANLSEAEGQIADVLFELKGLNEEINRVNGALSENTTKIKDTETQIGTTKLEIEKIEAEIVEIEKRIAARYDVLKERIMSYQKTGGEIMYLDVLAGSQSFSQFITRASAVSKISEADTSLLEQQKEDKKKVEKIRLEVEQKLIDQNELKADLEEIKALITVQKEKKEKDKQALGAKENELTTLKASLQGEDGTLASLEEKIRNEIIAANKPIIAKPVVNELTTPAYNSAALSNNDNQASNQTSNQATKQESNQGTNNKVETVSKPSLIETSPTASKVTAPSGNISTAINAGYKYIGNSVYVFGGGRSASDIQNGRFDCSAFVSWAFSQAGISLPTSTGGLSGVGTKISYSDIQPGDLVFFNTYKTNGHVGIYVGGGNFIGSQSSTGVSVVSMNNSYWKGVFTGHVRRVN